MAGVIPGDRAEAVVRSCSVGFLCASCTHSQCFTLALVGIYLCLPPLNKIIEMFCLFVFPGARGSSVLHYTLHLLLSSDLRRRISLATEAWLFQTGSLSGNTLRVV